VLSVLLRYMDSDCPFGIFKLFLTGHNITICSVPVKTAVQQVELTRQIEKTDPSIHVDASYQVSVHMAKQFQRRRCFRNRPIRNKNCMWVSSLVLVLNTSIHVHAMCAVGCSKDLWLMDSLYGYVDVIHSICSIKHKQLPNISVISWRSVLLV
jgi:hypothetical protein